MHQLQCLEKTLFLHFEIFGGSEGSNIRSLLTSKSNKLAVPLVQ